VDAERDLLAAWRAGDRSKGEALFERYFDCMYRFFATKVDGADVAELVQRTFLACVEASDSFRGEASVRSFFFGIARHQLHRYYRTRSRAPELDFGVSSVADLAPSPRSAVARGQQGQLLTEALRRIPLDLQIVLELRYLEGLRGPELATALAIPEGTVRSRLRRGLAAVRERVEMMSQSAEECRRALGGVDAWERLDQAPR
jgi:RNA polymerase sigma-70 factor (ECF subfamily)